MSFSNNNIDIMIPLLFQNWQNAINGLPLKNQWQFMVYTDAKINGIDKIQVGPYNLNKRNDIDKKNNLLSKFMLIIDNHLNIDFSEEPEKTDFQNYHGGTLADEITAILSLLLGIRLKPGRISKINKGDSIATIIDEVQAIGSLNKEPILLKYCYNLPILPSVLLREIDISKNNILKLSLDLSEEKSNSLIKAARLYQDSIWIAESQPELSWVMLVSAIEVAAVSWSWNKPTNLELLENIKPKIVSLIKESCRSIDIDKIADYIAPLFKATGRFIDFIVDKKIEPPLKRPQDKYQVNWINLKKSLSIIYDLRSDALHNGIPFPLPMCASPQIYGEYYQEKPLPDNSKTGYATSSWDSKDLPMTLNMFEYIVRNSLIKWWYSILNLENKNIDNKN